MPPFEFTQDFATDFELLLGAWTAREPFAFARFGDGEAAILRERPVPFRVQRPTETWDSKNIPGRFRAELWDSLRYKDEGYYVGMQCPACSDISAKYLRENVSTPLDRQTYAELFCYQNWHRIDRAKFTDACIVTSSSRPEQEGVDSLLIPINAAEILDAADTVEALLEVRKPILVAAGPFSNVVIHQYWTKQLPELRQPIVDIGSALDPWLHDTCTRDYQNAWHYRAQRFCTWDGVGVPADPR